MDQSLQTQQPTIKSVFERDDVKQRFQEMLGKKSAGFIVSVINAITSNALLRDADRDSILFAAATAASLDLPINQNLGFAYIVPYNQKLEDGTYKQFAQFQLGYKGFVQLALRSGQVKTINVVPVYDGDDDESVLKRLTAIITPKPPSETVTGYAAYLRTIQGFEKTHYMTIEDLKKHAGKYSKTYASTKSWVKEKSLWNTDFDAMAMKTVLKLLIAKWALLSPEMQRAVVADQGIVKGWDGDVEYPDNDEVRPDLEATAKAEEQARVLNHIQNAKSLVELEQAEIALSTEDLRTAYDQKKKDLSKAK